MRAALLFAAATLLVSGGDAARILGVFPYPSRSHMIVFSSLTKELARRGHELVVLSPYPLPSKVANYTDVDIMPAMKAVHDAVFNADVYDFADFPLHLILKSFWEEGIWVSEEFLKYDKVHIFCNK
jgi:glucuronosyltransferase